MGKLFLSLALGIVTFLAGNASAGKFCAPVGCEMDLSNAAGNLPVARLNNGTSAGSATYWRGDGKWTTPAKGDNIRVELGDESGNMNSINNTADFADTDDINFVQSGIEISGVIRAGVVDGEKLAAAQKTLRCNFNVKAPVAGDDGDYQCHIPDAATLVRAYCSTDTSTSNINFYERTEGAPNTGTTGMLTSNLTCSTSGVSSSTFSDSVVAADANIALGLITPFTSGIVRASLEYTVD